jgi:branched-chain amino acid transport system substrate-binding protein
MPAGSTAGITTSEETMRVLASLATAGLISLSALASAPSARAEDVRIGFISTFSGPAGYFGEDMRDGFMLGLKHSEGKMGGAKVAVLVEDDTQQPGKARQIANKFLTADKVSIITGVAFSNVAGTVAPLALESNAFYISPNAGPSNYAGEKCDKNYFVVSWQNDNPHEAVGHNANEKGYKKAFLMATNYQAGKDVLNGFKRTFKGEIIEELYTPMNQMDYSTEIAKIRSIKPDMVFEFLPGGMGSNFLKQYAQAEMMKDYPLMLPGTSLDERTLASVGEIATGIRTTMHWTEDLQNQANKTFVAGYRKAYNRAPTIYASQAYDTAMLIASALRETKGKVSDRDAFRAALKAAKFESVRGAFRFGNNNHPIQDWYNRVIEKGPDGQMRHRTEHVVLQNHVDAYASACPMK